MKAQRAALLAISALLCGAPLAWAEEKTPEEKLEQAKEFYETNLRHHLPQRAGNLVGNALDLAGLAYALPEMWRTIENDPTLRAGWQQLKLQYKPSFHWSGYAGGLAESTSYSGLTIGGSFDIKAPLCRYLSAQADAQAFHERARYGVAYDTRITGCLPWGPFSFEVGLLRQRDLRVGLQSTPSLPTTRYDSQAVEIGIRSYRWFAKTWEGHISPTDVVIRGFTATNDDEIPETSSFSIDSAFYRHVSYGRGFVGADRTIEAIPILVLGQQEDRVARMSAVVIAVDAVGFTGARLADDLYLDGSFGFIQASIRDMDAAPEEYIENGFHFGMEAALHRGSEQFQTSLRYRRRIVPDSDFRLLAEDRLDGVVQLFQGVHQSSVTPFLAYTRQKGAPPGTDALEASLSYGAAVNYGRHLGGSFYLHANAAAARSFYASISGVRLLSPEFEVRGLVSVQATIGSE